MIRWWETEAEIERHIAGVFEGGGAKGIAYVGALHALHATGTWFSAVAGASAGAITAALIASGLRPDELEAQTPEALRTVATTRIRGSMRLANTAAYFDNEQLRGWLAKLLSEQVHGEPGRSVTFAELFAASGIELNIVAADLTMRQQVIFSHLDTPDCQVADAVAASSAIPFAFGAGILALSCGPREKGSRTLRHHLVVDGGVWSNYPMFVFRDRGFRRYYGRPELPDELIVVGFLLQESVDRADEQLELRQRLARAKFGAYRDAHPCQLENHSAATSGAVQTLERPQRDGWQEKAALFRALGSLAATVVLTSVFLVLTIPIIVVAYFYRGAVGGLADYVSEMIDQTDRLRRHWRPSSKRWKYRPDELVVDDKGWFKLPGGPSSRIAARTLGYTLNAIQPLMLGLAFWFSVAWAVTSTLVIGLFAAAFDDFKWSIVYLGVAFALCLALMLLLIVVVALHYLYTGMRRLAIPLAATYVAGPGAPPWAHLRDHVVELSIQPPLSTLAFDLSDAQRKEVMAAARAEALPQIRKILSECG